MAPFLPPPKDTQGALVTLDARRIWETTEQVSGERHLARHAAPPDDETQSEVRQMNKTVFMSRLLRPHDHQMQEPAWPTRAVNLLPYVEDNYLEPLTLDPGISLLLGIGW